MAATTLDLEAVMREVAAHRKTLDALLPAHEQRVAAMVAPKAQQTARLIDESKDAIARDVEAYYTRRIAEGAAIDDQISAIDKETRLFETFHLIAQHQLQQEGAGACGAQ